MFRDSRPESGVIHRPPTDIGLNIKPCTVVYDKGYASRANRKAARKRGIATVIPPTRPMKKKGPPSSPRRSTKRAPASNKV